MDNVLEYALETLKRIAEEFPGLVDGETEVNGAELTESLSRMIQSSKKLTIHLGKDSDSL